MSDKVNYFKEYLGKDHLLHTMIVEHELILGFLDQLENLNGSIQKSADYNEVKTEIDSFKKVVNLIIDAEPHHQREENVLFPELEKKGVIGPTNVMRAEHHQLRQLKHDIKNLIENGTAENFLNTKKDLNSPVSYLVNNLRDHISKENNILYPMSLDFISGNEQWKEMKSRCDEIGYCSFTPLSLTNSRG